MRERVWLAYPPAYLGSFRSASKSNMAVKMTTAFAFLKNSGCPIYPSHHPWECKLHEKGSSHAEGGERRRKACLSAFQRLVLHSPALWVPPKVALARLFQVITSEVGPSNASCHRFLGRQGKGLILRTGSLLRSGLSCVCPNLPPW